MKSKRVGSTFNSFLVEEGILDRVNARAQKHVFAWQLQQAMRKARITRAEMARRMKTSRAAVDRLLDPDHAGVTLTTMNRAASALGKQLEIGLSSGRR